MAIIPKQKIIETYNLSIDAIEKAHIEASNNNFAGSLEEISRAATLTYNTIEWFFKNYLLNKFPDNISNKAEWDIIEGNKFHLKIKLFERNAIPSLSSVGLNLKVVTELKQSVRNDPEHSGITPHYPSLIEVMGITKELLKTYFQINPVQLREIPNNLEKNSLVSSDEWNKFFTNSERFDSNYNYILITDLSNSIDPIKKSLSMINWSAIIDLDKDSEVSGLFHSIGAEYESKRSVHRMTLNDTLPISFSKEACYWIYANGLNGRNNSIFQDFKFWNKNYTPYLTKVFNKLQTAISTSPTIVIVITDNIKASSEITKQIFNSFTTSVKFLFVSQNPTLYKDLAEEYDGSQISLSYNQIALGLLELKKYFNSNYNNLEIIIPHRDNGFTTIEQIDYKWLVEDIDLLHKHIYEQFGEDHNERIDFYKGGPINWKGIMLNYDLERSFTSYLEPKIEKALRERINKTINLYHYPGMGGTTISKRLGWKFKDKVPVAFVKNYRPNETINRINKIFQFSSLPPLVILDTELINIESIERIQHEALSKTFPVTFLVVERKVTKPNLQNNGDEYLSEILNDSEVITFAHSYGELSPSKKVELSKLIDSASTKEKHPLFFGLTAFEETFTGLGDFVGKAINSANPVQKKIIALICLVGVYGHKSISAQTFAPLLSFPDSQVLKLEDFLNESLLHLIIKEDKNSWKPLHYLVAKKYLELLYKDNDTLLSIGLSELSMDLINLIGDRSVTPSKTEYEIIDRLFIERNEEDGDNEDDKPFSKLIQEGLYDENAKLKIFVRLTEVFNDKAHYWSHLARFYNLVVKDQNQALECINIAIDIDKDNLGRDATLNHIKGMILKSQAGVLMNRMINPSIIGDTNDLGQIKNLIGQANKEFQKSRELNSNSDYGYITNVDAIMAYLDFKYKLSNTSNSNRAKFITTLDDFDLDLFTHARLLLEELKSKIHHNPNEYYFQRSKNKITEFFNDYNYIIQSWQNLLSSNNKVDKFAIRQNLVHAYVGRADGWDNLQTKDLEKILRLLNENIEADNSNGKNIFLWFKAARISTSEKIEKAIHNLVKWKSLDSSIEVSFYLAVLYTIQAIEGHSLSSPKAKLLINEVSEKSRNYPYRTYITEWYGNGNELQKLKPNKAIVTKSSINREITYDKSQLKEVKGKISNIKGPEIGEIEFADGLTASFVPARAEGGKGLIRGKDENKDVKFILGFCYDGVRAHEVHLV